MRRRPSVRARSGDAARGEIEASSIPIESGAPMPDSLPPQGEPCANGWTFFSSPNRSVLETDIHKAGLTFFYPAGEIKAKKRISPFPVRRAGSAADS